MTEHARILVVDDEIAIQRSLGPLLRSRGYTVDLASNGAEALQLFKDNAPDLVVLDLGLPDMQGAEVCRRIRSLSTVPIVVLSARGAEADKVDALDRGADDYVLHFERDELPPVDAFWSVTMYDADGFQAANPLNRFAIGDRDALTLNDDGSLDLYLQHESPGPERESNWLPAPRGPLGVTMRLYAPKPEVLEGRWHAPPIRKVG